MTVQSTAWTTAKLTTSHSAVLGLLARPASQADSRHTGERPRRFAV
jgi:hypothetical protein